MQIKYKNISDLKPHKNNSRVHSKAQIQQIAESIKKFSFNVPVLIDGDSSIIAGHGRVLACKELGMEEVPVIEVTHLTEAQRRAFIIADNKLTENAGWDLKLLSSEFTELQKLDLDFNLDITGFSSKEINLIIENNIELGSQDENLDNIPKFSNSVISKTGDIWQMGAHKLLCADARDKNSYEVLLGSEKAQMVITDPPYNVKIDGHVSGLGKVKHQEFQMASGEMSGAEFTQFLSSIFSNLVDHTSNGSIHYVFMDWRHMQEILAAGQATYAELKNLCVWNKSNGRMGSFYRNKHELVFVFKNGKEPHINNFELGQYGRFRTNVWDYEAASSFGSKENPDGQSDLEMHPTVKPVQMISDAILDCSKTGGVILDPFMGSGTTIIAAENTSRCAYGIEIEPRYVDLTIRRWQYLTGSKALNLIKGLVFDEMAISEDAI